MAPARVVRVVRLHCASELLGALNCMLKVESLAPTLQRFRLRRPRNLDFLKSTHGGSEPTVPTLKKQIPPRR